ncbi:MAG: hypothetical protein US69_C0016G0014 [candidate division TM6 bacterium GW2011_GWF2_38_10]|nr:MAG: hypothetical protein US69_C0016G0014 [candidate division TM6 bacterium GW2011_GWF2_38_10]
MTIQTKTIIRKTIALTLLFASASLFTHVHGKTQPTPNQPPHVVQDVTLSNGLNIIFINDPEASHMSSHFTFKNIPALTHFLIKNHQIAAFQFLMHHILDIQILMYADTIENSHDTSEQIEHLLCSHDYFNEYRHYYANDTSIIFDNFTWDFKKTCLKADAYYKCHYQEFVSKFKADKDDLIKRSLESDDDDEDDDSDGYITVNKENMSYLYSMLGTVLARHNNLVHTKIYTFYKSMHAIIPDFAIDIKDELPQFLTDKNLMRLAQAFFNPANIILEISGNFTDHFEIARICTYFENWKNRAELIDVTKLTLPKHVITPVFNNTPMFTTITIPQPPQKTIPPLDHNKKIIMAMDNRETIDDHDYGAMHLLEIIINEHLSNLKPAQDLFQGDIEFSISHKNNDLNYIDEVIEIPVPCDAFISILAAPQSHQCEQAQQFIINFLNELTTAHYTQQGLDKARIPLQEKLLHYITSTSYMQFKAYDVPYNYYQKQLQSLDTITPQDLQRVAKKYLDPKTWTFVTIEPEPEQAQPKRWFSWF